MKKLVIAEKPSVARDIARVLGCNEKRKNYIEGKQYIVTWGLGHLVTLADPESYDKKLQTWKMEDLPMMPEHLKLVVIPQTRAQFQAVKTLIHSKEVSEIIIATDAGREGELVARWILVKAGNKKPLKRLWISSVTDKAIREGFSRLKDAKEYENLYRAAVSRAEADWLVGINATRALTCKYNAQLSCGRVQTPTLAMIAAREDEIRHFKPVPYYGLNGRWNQITFTWKEKKSGSSSVFSKESRDHAYEKASKGGVITDVQKKGKTSYPAGLYDLTELQRDANQRFGFSAKQTLNLMQSLYEHHKVLTYPRTDSKYIPQDVVETLKDRVAAVAAGPYKPFTASILKAKIKANKSFVDDRKVSDHHAIIPTEQPVILQQLSMEERKIFDLVVRRFLAVLYPPYEYEQTTLTLDCGGEIFVAKGNVMKKKGYREVYSDGNDDNIQTFPDVKKGEKVEKITFFRTEGKTKPPARFTEGTLLAAMENPIKYMYEKDTKAAKTLQETGGLGTVATRADIIDKLFRTFLIEKKENDIYLTGKARQLLELVPEDLKKPELTASWEMKLSNMAQGKLRQNVFMTEIRSYAVNLTEEIKTANGTFRHDNITNKICPNCGKRLLSVNGKQGKMLVCQDRECGYRERISRATNARCPVCHKRMELIGPKGSQKFVCACGHKEALKSFEERRKKEGAGVSKKDVNNYMKKMKKEEKKPVNSGLADALANIKLNAFFFLFLCMGMLLSLRMDAQAAFPVDMEQKPVVAYGITYDTVDVYADAGLTKSIGQVDGSELKIKAVKTEGKSIFGSYTAGEEKGSGWFPMDVFVENPDYKNVYATVRDAMNAYTDSSCSQVSGIMKKYTGIIVISKDGSHRQVIFETNNGYKIGWITRDTFSNCLLYDGRDKQIIADGAYQFRSGYIDDENGGVAMSEQTNLDLYGTWNLKVQYVSDGMYYLVNQSDGMYLTVEKNTAVEKNATVEKNTTAEKSGDGEDGNGKDRNGKDSRDGLWKVSWKTEPSNYSLFTFQRITGSFSIQNEKTKLFLCQSKNKNLILSSDRSLESAFWRISALSRIVDIKDPFVFTQYDPEWCYTPYGTVNASDGCMGTSACGILAAVNAVYALSGEYMDVMELADYAVEKNYRIVGSGTDDGIFKAACKKYGRKYNFAWDGFGGSIDQLRKKLKAGDVAIVHVQGHYVCIVDYDEKKDKYLLLDSNYLPKRATSAFGDWISTSRLLSGALESQGFYYYKGA